LLAKDGIQAAVWNCASVKPLDFDALSHLGSSPVITIEEHSVLGGFGSAVAEFLSARKNPPRLIRLGIPDEFLHDCGEQEEARIYCGLDATSLARRILAEIA
jgi:transketolase C-terminal domain/subunit